MQASPQFDSRIRRILGLAMIAVGLVCFVAQFVRGGEARAAAQISNAATQSVPGMSRIENASLETRAVSGSLDSTFRELLAKAATPQWVGYSVAQIAGEHDACCSNWSDGSRCGTCFLEKEHETTGTTRHSDETVRLEGARQLIVLFRLETNQVVRIRVAAANCTLDAGGLPFIWLTGVKPAESVSLLETHVRAGNFARHGGDHGIGNGALTAIALHADSAADRAFESFTAPDQPEELRRQAAFWMGAARGNSGFIGLQRMAKNDPSSDVRAHVTFALSVSHEPGALTEIIRMAHDDASAHVRSQALFWLAQRAGKKAASTVTGAIENDPDTDVKKKAVFALSQMPKDEGVPKLIEVAQTNRNPEVRKQAMFWLGQSHDPRALQFFEKILAQ